MQADRVTGWLERQELLELHGACPQALRAELGLDLVDTGPALVSVAARESSILLNRAVGLGLGHRVSAEAVRDVVRVFKDHGVRDYFIHLDRDGVDVSDAELGALGLEPARAWQRFERGPAPPPEVATELEVRRLQRHEGAEQFAGFGRIAAQAFGLSPGAARLLAAAGAAEGLRLFMSFYGGQPAGTGALLVVRHPDTHELCGWLDMGASLPEFRRRGGQGALIAARIREALSLGCTRIATETGKAVPGDPQHSYKNLVRAGFVATTVKQNWRPKREP